jgi:8-oxo-dGTP pyrophosphatase MutT (NUDIX family)
VNKKRAVADEAGALAVRGTGTQRLLLLVTAKRDASQWIFPKGHIERGESSEDAALRELREEAGVSGTIRAPVGVLSFEFARQTVRVQYFLVDAANEGTPQEGRQLRWVTLAEARKMLAFADAVGLVDRIETM